MDIQQIQSKLAEYDIDGWLLYDYHGSNRFARELLTFSPIFMTRRFFYWIPREGEPKKLLHAIEANTLPFLSGKEHLYLSWKDLEEKLQKILGDARKIAMEYSKGGRNPLISVVDGGTIELMQRLGYEVVSSEDLLQHCTSVLTEEQIESHLQASEILEKIVLHGWELIVERIKQGKKITEYDVQKFILSEFTANNCITEEGPICAVNENSASPHYVPSKGVTKEIQQGDFLLIDLWCKLDKPGSVYADLTKVATLGSQPTAKQQEIFTVVKEARDLALGQLQAKKRIRGADLDDTCRNYIKKKGYGAFFIHRSGHNLDGNVHGAGANLDNFETSDQRQLLPSTCFSLEPAIYLPGEFGVRVECNVLIRDDMSIEVTGKQDALVCLL